VGIINRALARCGIKQFITATTDTSQEAIVSMMFWDQVRQQLLGAFPWKFAIRQAPLEEFAPACSAVERIGTGPAGSTMITALAASSDLEGSYNVVGQVTAAGGTSTGYIKWSVDGGISFGSPVVYSSGAQTIGNSGGTGVELACGSGLEMTGTIEVTLASGQTLVAGDIYRFTATDGLSFEYNYGFLLPADMLIGRYIWSGARSIRPDQRIPFKRGNFGSLNVLWTDIDPSDTPKIIYVEDVTDASRFPAGFADALAWKLAYEISGPLKAEPAPQALMQAYLLAVNEARSVDFIEFQEDMPPDSEVVAARGDAWNPYQGSTYPLGWGWLPL
jgi:hypothetical protein